MKECGVPDFPRVVPDFPASESSGPLVSWPTPGCHSRLSQNPKMGPGKWQLDKLPRWFSSLSSLRSTRVEDRHKGKIEHSRQGDMCKPKFGVMDIHGTLRICNRPKLYIMSITRWCHRLTTELKILKRGDEMISKPLMPWVSVPPSAFSIGCSLQ